jgi:hypothetical protein
MIHRYADIWNRLKPRGQKAAGKISARVPTLDFSAVPFGNRRAGRILYFVILGVAKNPVG